MKKAIIIILAGEASSAAGLMKEAVSHAAPFGRR